VELPDAPLPVGRILQFEKTQKLLPNGKLDIDIQLGVFGMKLDDSSNFGMSPDPSIVNRSQEPE
jgi:hypothetical protein